ncbi:hypothetical protein K435DRAFT_60709 [Dendrothele bispora CBS 962.96]|uniref:Uncharacterized protein n=1 Tax=Dendrothele bispora (strain CBS 962.96) TaxID=1314807 RepID=A0A4S8M684_DENBC|nr:hypothetical protein K435DRAFT_60709 [Dendrothele bispora CBS 962.96]
MEFPYLKDDEQLAEFDTWIQGLDNPHVSAWWKHKRVNKWILPTIIQSQSKMDPSDWTITKSTTNIGEGQHYWTRKNTGEKLSLVASIVEARKVDFRVAAEIKAARTTGVLGNNRNSAFDRMKNSSRRANTAIAKQQVNQEQNVEIQRLQQEIEEHTKAKKDSDTRIKQARQALALTRSDGKSRSRSSRAESSSSGRVRVAGLSQDKGTTTGELSTHTLPKSRI